jgi:hypothetical protein
VGNPIIHQETGEYRAPLAPGVRERPRWPPLRHCPLQRAPSTWSCIRLSDLYQLLLKDGRNSLTPSGANAVNIPPLRHSIDRGRLGKESSIVQIEFPPGETNDTTRWIVWFLAVVNGKQIHCGISYQALRTHCGADFHDPLPAFVAHRPRIETFIRELIELGRFEEDETVVIRTQDL